MAFGLKLLFLFLTMTSCAAKSKSGLKEVDQLPSFCSDSTIKHISVESIPGQKKSMMVDFLFQDIADANPDAPAIIVLPGGPGGTSIGTWFPDASPLFAAVPSKGFRIIMIDPRGTGCNVNMEIPDEGLTTEYVASDVLAVIKQLKLKQYFLKGHSYGTAVATVIAAKASSEGNPPSAVVLSGVVGRSFSTDEMLNERGPPQWERLFSRLPKLVQEKLSKSPLPFGASETAWLTFINSMLEEGAGFVNGNYVNPKRDLLLALATEDQEKLNKLKEAVLQEETSAALQTTPPTGDSGTMRSFYVIGCQELFPHMVGQPTFRNGKIKYSVESQYDCPAFHLSLLNPFDSKQWQMKSPTFYFQGAEDPSVPNQIARYHFENQKNAPRFFVTVAGAGHSPLDGNMLDCRNQIWQSIAHSGREFDFALSSCGTKTSLEKRSF